MTIHIKNLQVQNLGPIESLQETLAQVNLFYGLNESGKTYLVEFLLHSLFRQSKNWELRKSIGKGSVQILGINSEPISFSPDHNQKIEHFWEEAGRGLPLNMARLLVVKGGELALSAGSPGGVDRDSLKSALTSQALLDQIWESIPPTVRAASLENGQILGKNMGLLKNHAQIREEINDLDRLLEEIEENYSQGPVRQIEEKLEAARNKLRDQHRARGYLAYQIRLKLQELTQQRETLSTQLLQELRDSMRDIENLNRDLLALEAKYEEEKSQSKEYRWLQTAIELWEEKGLDTKKSPSKLLGIAGLSGMGLGSTLLILERMIPMPELVWIGGGITLIGLGLSLYYTIQQLEWSNQIDDSRERISIREKYEKVFNSQLHGLADLKAQKSNLQVLYISAQNTQATLADKNNQKFLKSQAIENTFTALTGNAVPENRWQEILEELTQRSENLDNDILECKLQLSKLDVSDDTCHEDPAEVEYDPELTQFLEKEIHELEHTLADVQAGLDTLKVRACERTRADIKSPWTEVLFNLQALHQQRLAEFKELTAELIAKIGLTSVLTQLREEEDQKIIQAINSDSVSNLLNQITGRYHKLDLTDDQLFVYDAFNRYPLRDLSTGAREQVQLALRLGIASRICGGNPLFLILDDAFQHSDWQRREALIQSILNLACSGWQIIYLSMDNHIRDLFLKKVKPALKKDFKFFQLG